MKISLALFAILFSTGAFAQSIKHMPIADLEELQVNVTTTSEVEKMFGEPSLKTIVPDNESWKYVEEESNLRLEFDSRGVLVDYRYNARSEGEVEELGYHNIIDAVGLEYEKLIETLGEPQFVSIEPETQGLRYKSGDITLYADFKPNREAARFSFADNNGPMDNIDEDLVRDIEEGITTREQIASRFEGPSLIELTKENETWKYFADQKQLDLRFSDRGLVEDFRYRARNN